MPEFVRSERLETTGGMAQLVVDRLVGGGSFGGLRIERTISEDSLEAAARCMSRKFGFWGLPHGGAKASVELAADASRVLRVAAMEELGQRWAPLLREGVWQPAIDSGTDRHDIAALWRGAGLPDPTRLWRGRSHLYTAWGLLAAAEAGCAAIGENLEGARVVVQGLGRVGSVLLAELAGRGARVVGVAEEEGALVRAAGLDVRAVLAARSAGESLACCDGDFDASGRALYDEFAEVFCACASREAFTPPAIDALRARVLVPAANGLPGDRRALALEDAGVVVVPDFVANGGGVFGSFLDAYLGDAEIRRFLLDRLPGEIGRWVAHADERGASLAETLVAAAEARPRALGGRTRLAAAGRRVLPRFPRVLRRPLLLGWLARRTFPPLELGETV